MRTIEARAVISARDATGTIFSAIAAKIARLNTTAQSASRRSSSAALHADAVTRGQGAAMRGTAAASLAASGAARSVMGVGMGMAGLGGAGLAAGAVMGGTKAVKRYAETDMAITRIGITADATDGQVSKLNKSMRDLAFESGKSFDEVSGGLESLTAGGMDLPSALPAMPAIAKTAQAAGAEVKDMANTALALNGSLGISTEKMQSAFDILVTGGKAGKFELKDMSRYMASLGPAAAAAGYKGEDGLKRIVSVLQTIRQGSGSSEEAATSFADILGKMETEETANKFKKFGIDIRKEMEKTRKSGGDLMQTLLDQTEKATKGDLSKLPLLFAEKDSRRGILALLTYKNTATDVMAQLNKSAGSTMVDLEKVLSRPQIALNRLSESFDRAWTAAGALLDKMGSSKALDWIGKDLEDTAENGIKFPWQMGPESDAERDRVDADLKVARQQLDKDEREAASGKVTDHRSAFVKETARGGTSPGIAAQRAKVFELEQKRNALERDRSGFELFDPKEVERWEEIDRERRRGAALSAMNPEGVRKAAIPMPASDPRKAANDGSAGERNILDDRGGDVSRLISAIEKINVDKKSDEGSGAASRTEPAGPVTAELTGSAEVNGKAEFVVKVEAGSSLIAIEQNVKSAIAKLSGMLNTNGAGSTGKSSPDAAAPAASGASGSW